MKKFLMVFLIAGCMTVLTACAKENKENDGTKESSNREIETTAAVRGEETAAVPNETETVSGEIQTAAASDETEGNGKGPSYPAEDAESVTYESSLGYSMVYDPTLFTLDDTSGSDSFIYNTSESLAAPIYISVQAYADMDARMLAEGLALQSGVDDVTVQDTYFGKDSLEAKCVSYEQEINGVIQTRTFYAIPAAEGSLLVEIGGYAGMPAKAETRFEEMSDSFVLNEE